APQLRLRPNKHVIFEDHACPELDAAFDGDAIPDRDTAFDEDVVADVAFPPHDGARKDVREGPDARPVTNLIGLDEGIWVNGHQAPPAARFAASEHHSLTAETTSSISASESAGWMGNETSVAARWRARSSVPNTNGSFSAGCSGMIAG